MTDLGKAANVKGDDWKEMANLYKKLTVLTSHKPVTAILDRLNAISPFSSATAIHDNGCGPGGIITRIISDYGTALPPTCALSASDFSQPMIDQLQSTKAAEVSANPASPWARVEASVQDAMDLSAIPSSSVSHVTAGWVYFMTPDPQKCLSESLRILQPSGVLGLSSWQDSEWMRLMRLGEQIRPDKPMPGVPEAWRSVAGLEGELRKAGFGGVEAHEVEVEMTFEHYDPLLDLMTEKMPHMVHYLKDFEEEEKARFRALMLDRLRELAPTMPGRLRGWALVAVGRKEGA